MADFRVGMTQDPGERIKGWCEQEGYSYYLIARRYLSYTLAQQWEKFYADQLRGLGYSVDQHSGGFPAPLNNYVVYILSRTENIPVSIS